MYELELTKAVERTRTEVRARMVDTQKLGEKLTLGLPNLVRDQIVCGWMRDELKNRSDTDIAQYLTDFRVYVDKQSRLPSYELLFRFPVFLDPLETCTCDEKLYGSHDGEM